MKKFIKIIIVLPCLLLLISCGDKALTEGVWRSSEKEVHFLAEGSVTFKNEDASETFYYEIGEGTGGSKYIKLFAEKSHIEEGEYVRFLPYYIEGNSLRLDGTRYEFSKK